MSEVPGYLSAINIRTWDEAAKVLTVTCYCFTANTILLLGRNIGATQLLTGLGADALPYVMVLVGLFIMVIMPFVAYMATKTSSSTVLVGTTVIMIGILSVFMVLFLTGVADLYPKIVYPLFFVLEEVIDSLLMVLFWQIGMLCFTKDEASRLIGIVNMGAALANLANGVTVAILIHYFDSFAILPAQMVLLLLQLIPNAICQRWIKTDAEKGSSKPALTKEEAKGEAKGGGCLDQSAWYMHPLTQMIALWQFLTVLLFSCIEFQYNSTLANFLDANGIAQVPGPTYHHPLASHPTLPRPHPPPHHPLLQVTANLASVASVGQTAVNLLLTPWLLQHVGLWCALLVTPTAYILGEMGIMYQQTVAFVFVCRSMDFIFRYTVSDNTKQILYKSVPPEQLIEARAFTDGTGQTLARSAPPIPVHAAPPDPSAAGTIKTPQKTCTPPCTRVHTHAHPLMCGMACGRAGTIKKLAPMLLGGILIVVQVARAPEPTRARTRGAHPSARVQCPVRTTHAAASRVCACACACVLPGDHAHGRVLDRRADGLLRPRRLGGPHAGRAEAGSDGRQLQEGGRPHLSAIRWPSDGHPIAVWPPADCHPIAIWTPTPRRRPPLI